MAASNQEEGKICSKSWIKLNVGGTHFLTTKTTLSRDPKSFLARLIMEDPELPTDKVSVVYVEYFAIIVCCNFNAIRNIFSLLFRTNKVLI